jgi:hypothetical protein
VSQYSFSRLSGSNADLVDLPARIKKGTPNPRSLGETHEKVWSGGRSAQRDSKKQKLIPITAQHFFETTIHRSLHCKTQFFTHPRNY